jgi:hypothetical protein
MNTPKLSLKVIACEVAQREICLAAAQGPNLVDLEFLPVGYHDDPKQGHQELQGRIDRLPAGQFDAILIGYGICNLILNGLTARHTRLIVPRAHDCITLFLGSKERYAEIFGACPGTYYFTAGWLEFAQRKALQKGGVAALRQAIEDLGDQASPFGLSKTFAELVAKYGEDNARYLIQVTEQWAKNYSRGMLINFDFDGPLALREKVSSICQKRGWRFEELSGDLALLRRWLAGEWNSADFLEVPPEHSVHPVYNENVIEARPAGTYPRD